MHMIKGLPVTILVLIFLLKPLHSCGQLLKLPSITLKSTGQYNLSDQPTFWLMSNRFGKFELTQAAALASIKIETEHTHDSFLDINYGLEMVGGTGGAENAWVHQAYLMVDFQKFIRFRAGWMEERIGNGYKPLTSGEIIWSANARPLPKIEFGSAGFVDVPYTNGLFQINGSIAHGWFESGRHVENLWLHQKYAGARTRFQFPVNISFTYHHFAQWGGKHPTFGQLPNGLNSFKKVFFIQAGDENAPVSWQINRFGNHIGSRSYGIDYERDHYSVKVYLQDVFEDGSGGRKKNYPDGLWGLVWIRQQKGTLVDAFLFEYLQTTNQSGPLHDPEQGLSGDDNYFNHGTYQSGWTHHRMTIGTPFITSPLFYNNIDHPRNISIWNNRVQVNHVGVLGTFPWNIKYRLLVSYGRNKGLHASESEVPEMFDFAGKTRRHLGWLVALNSKTPLPGLEAEMLLSGDRGEMYGNNLGFSLSFIYKVL